MNDKIIVENLYKIFGPDPDRGMKLLGEGKGKDKIFETTRNTVGVQDASFTIREGEIFVIMGLSGSGKSTMVRMLNRLIEPTSGRVVIGDSDVTAMSRSELIHMRRHSMSMVFQSFALMPHRTVLENAAFGLEVAGGDKATRRDRAMSALEQVGLKANADSYPSELSGGMQQRVGLARALATDPEIMLMDEAFSALDPLIRTEMQDELIELQREHKRTVVFISHDLDEAMRIGDRIAIMQDGAVVQVGSPEEIVTEPANDYVKSFFHGVDVTQVFSAGDLADRDQVTVFERPGTGIRAALDRLQRHHRSIGIVIGEDHTYHGMVTADTLAEQAEAAEPKFETAIVERDRAISADADLNEVVQRAAETIHPIPVVDERGHYIGSISRATVLRTLGRAGGSGTGNAA